MKKLNLDDVERAFHNEMVALSTDEHGNEVFVGLDPAESDWFCQYMQDTKSEEGQERRRADKTKYWLLYEKHDLARLKVLGATTQRRAFKPTQH